MEFELGLFFLLLWATSMAFEEKLGQVAEKLQLILATCGIICFLAFLFRETQ